MKIKKGTSVAVVINRDWANLQGVRLFLRKYDNPENEIRGADKSHVVFSRMVDYEDPNGLWIELYAGKHKQDPTVKKYRFMIPWNHILCIVIVDDLAALQEKAPKIGFDVSQTNQ